MNFLECKSTLSVANIDGEMDYSSFVSMNERGLRFVAERARADIPAGLKSDFGDFAKWIQEKHIDFPVYVPDKAPRIMLRSADVWLPLAYLAGDTSVQLFLNMAASYLYDRAKGSLKTDQPRIHMSAIYQDKSTGKTKKFEFEGDAEALSKAIKRFDLNNFFDDTP
jgi:hypothetical protein